MIPKKRRSVRKRGNVIVNFFETGYNRGLNMRSADNANLIDFQAKSASNMVQPVKVHDALSFKF